MIRASFIGLIGLCFVTACSEAQDVADQLARKQAKQTVNSQVAGIIPGVDLTFATDCVIDNASAQEIFTLARASVTGVNAQSGALITEIAQRPDTIQCILKKRFGVS
ncbi:MAG: succinate dehydrogenase [Planktomarina sp.]